MKKAISALLSALILIPCIALFSSCSKAKYELVLITMGGGVTGKNYDQSAWDGMTEFAIEHGLDCRYFIPASTTHDGLLSQVRSAADDGAKVIVTAGKKFETVINTAQREYPDVKFILLDGMPHPADTSVDDVRENTASILYNAEQAGFLAGYAAVSDGYTSLGFMGGFPDTDTKAYGYGFLQGVKYAASAQGVTPEIRYQYTGNTEKNDDNKQKAADMYVNGADLIFASGGDMELSVADAATDKRGKVICSDTDKRHASNAVITSAVKDVSTAVRSVLGSIYDTKNFEQKYGGKITYYNASNGGAGLSTFVINDINGDAFDRFIKFTKEDYQAILSKLASGEITVKRDIPTEDRGGYAKAEELISAFGLDNMTVNVIQ